MIIVVTGACGFIGSNLIKALNNIGFSDIIAVDDLVYGDKFKNIVSCDILDYVDKSDFIRDLINGEYENKIGYIFHLGSNANTTESNGKSMMDNNYNYSCILLEYAQNNSIPMVYASSAAVYGANNIFLEDKKYESPLNVYGYSKFLFDQVVRRYIGTGLSAPIVGLRYFNVYGYGEFHKQQMSSVVYKNFHQFIATGSVQLFKGLCNFKDGGHMRDFVYIDDVIATNLFFFNNHTEEGDDISGIFNCGTGVSRSFNDLSTATVNSIYKYRNSIKYSMNSAFANSIQKLDQLYKAHISESNHNKAKTQTIATQILIDNSIIQYIDFPSHLINKYQTDTCADITKLRAIGFNYEFTTLEEGVDSYIKKLCNDPCII